MSSSSSSNSNNIMAIGNNASAIGNNANAIANELLASNNRDVAIGNNAAAIKNNTLAIGNNTLAINSNALQIEQVRQGIISGVIVFQTKALLDAHTPIDTAQESGSFKVTNDPLSANNGYYSWVSGTTYTKDTDLVNGSVEVGNVDAVNGGAVFDFTQDKFNSVSRNTSELSTPSLRGNTELPIATGANIAGTSNYIQAKPMDADGVLTHISVMAGSTGALPIKIFADVDGYFIKVFEVSILVVEGYATYSVNIPYQKGQYVAFQAGSPAKVEHNTGVVVDDGGWYSGDGDSFIKGAVSDTTNLSISYVGADYGVLPDISNRVALLESENELSVDMASDLYAYAITDCLGSPILLVDNSGKLYPQDVTADTNTNTERAFDFEINQVFCYGQSLSIGGHGAPAKSLTQNYDNLMFSRGMIPQYSYPSETTAQWYAALVPSIEEVSPENALLGETIITASGDKIKELILAEDSISYTEQNYQMLGSCPGVNGSAISGLVKSTEGYTRFLDQVTFARARALELGKIHGFQCVYWMQGEADTVTPVATYKTSLAGLIADTNTDVKLITGQVKDIPFISYQTARTQLSNAPIAQQELEEENPLMIISHPNYLFEKSDGLHFTTDGTLYAAAYYGLAYKRIIINKETWRPVTPTKVTAQGKVCVIDIHTPTPPLKFDVSQVTSVVDSGFTVLDDLGAPVAISAVEISNPSQIKITLAENFATGYKVGYAREGKGNLRDSQGDTVTTLVDGVSKRMDNWCLIFEKEIV